MRLSILLFYHILLYSTHVASVVYPWIDDDLLGGQTAYIRFIDDGIAPLLVDSSFFEIVIFSGGNQSPVSHQFFPLSKLGMTCAPQVTLYTSQKYNFSRIPEIDDPNGSELGQKSYFLISIFVPWSIGPNIARG